MADGKAIREVGCCAEGWFPRCYMQHDEIAASFQTEGAAKISCS